MYCKSTACALSMHHLRLFLFVVGRKPRAAKIFRLLLFRNSEKRQENFFFLHFFSKETMKNYSLCNNNIYAGLFLRSITVHEESDMHEKRALTPAEKWDQATLANNFSLAAQLLTRLAQKSSHDFCRLRRRSLSTKLCATTLTLANACWSCCSA